MGWIFVLGLALLVAAALWRFGRLSGAALQMVWAGLTVAVAGYAWQGSPYLHGKPAAPPVEEVEVGGEAFAQLRQQILGRFDNAGWWLTIADSYLRRGDTFNAVGVLGNAVNRHPQDPDLWIGLGNALVLHSEGMITPAAELAFERAQQRAGTNPAPLFFYGLALAEGGRFQEADAAWRKVLAALPPDASWRPLVEQKLRLLEQLRIMAERAAAAQQAPPSQ
ncbi:MAG: tetratricopeptide repeat protein [Sphingomonadales bacterium]